MLRTVQSLPQEWAFDTGLRPRPFPDEAASLLPGPLAATRTGLTPASDDELTTQDRVPRARKGEADVNRVLLMCVTGQEMEAGPLEPSCRRWLETTAYCAG